MSTRTCPCTSSEPRILTRSTLSADNERLVTSAEVLQEIFHRYVAIERRDAIQPAFDALLGVVDEVYPIEQRDVERATIVLDGGIATSARDALHVAVMVHHGVTRILTFDRAFDALPGVDRVS